MNLFKPYLASSLQVLLVTIALCLVAGCELTNEMKREEADIQAALNSTATDPATIARQDAAAGQREFAGLNFGVGISLTLDTGSNDRIESAEIVDGIVRVTDENDAVARVMLESHYFFQPHRRFFNIRPRNWGIGPFIALQPGTDEIIEAVGAGLMIGFKRPDKSGTSWNMGFGFVVDPNVQVLGDDFVANQEPPMGVSGAPESQIRFKEKSQTGFLIVASFSF